MIEYWCKWLLSRFGRHLVRTRLQPSRNALPAFRHFGQASVGGARTRVGEGVRSAARPQAAAWQVLGEGVVLGQLPGPGTSLLKICPAAHLHVGVI